MTLPEAGTQAGPDAGIPGAATTLSDAHGARLDAVRLAGGASGPRGPRRILYAPGPGDVHGTWLAWSRGDDDPRNPALSYSQQVYEFAARLGARLTVLTDTPPPPDAPVSAEAPVRFVHRPTRQARGGAYHLGRIADAAGIAAFAMRERADLVICQKYLDHFWPLALSRLAGTRTLVSLHNSLWPAHRAPKGVETAVNALNGLGFRIMGRPVICVSEAICDQVRRIAGPTLRDGTPRPLLQVPLYGDAWRDAWTPRPADRPARRILFVGRVGLDKGVIDLMRAFEGLSAAHPEARLTYLGGGAYLDRLREAAAASPAAARIEVKGNVDGAEVRARTLAADVLVCPTTTRFSEGLAKTPIEAALCGTPSVVSSNVPCADMLKGAARVFRADDAEDLRHTLDEILSDPAALVAMNAAARDRRAAFFDRARSLSSRLVEAAGF